MLKVSLLRLSFTGLLGLLALTVALTPAGHVALARREPLKVSGTSWHISSTVIAALQGTSKKLKAPAQAGIRFGPVGDLAANEFDITVSDGKSQVHVSGTYVQDARGKVTVTPSVSQEQDAIKDLLAANVPGIARDSLDVSILKSTFKVSVKPAKNGAIIVLNLSLKVGVTASGSKSAKGSLSFKGKGAED